MNIKWKFFVLLCILLLSAGCVPSKSVEENAIVQISGYDRGGDGGRIKGTVSIPQYGKSEKKTAASELYLTVDAQLHQGCGKGNPETILQADFHW